MMKIKKILMMFGLMLCLCACTSNESDVVESKEPFTVQLFFSKNCPHCKQLKENLLPAIEDEFKEQVTIEQYDIDEEASIELYDSYIGIYDPDEKKWILEGKLANVDEDSGSNNYYIPLMVISDKYAFMGYDNDLKNAYIQDIHLMLQGKSLASGSVANGRFLFKDDV